MTTEHLYVSRCCNRAGEITCCPFARFDYIQGVDGADFYVECTHPDTVTQDPGDWALPNDFEGPFEDCPLRGRPVLVQLVCHAATDSTELPTEVSEDVKEIVRQLGIRQYGPYYDMEQKGYVPTQEEIDDFNQKRAKEQDGEG